MKIMDKEPLNPLQRAYLMGRNSEMPLGGVAMHDFRHFRCNFTAEALKDSVQKLALKHAALRTMIDETALEKVVKEDVSLNIEVIDLSHHSVVDANAEVVRLSEEYSHTKLPLDLPLWRMWLILLPKSGRADDKFSVLFTSFDGLVVDGYAISVLLNELFNTHFERQIVSTSKVPGSYFANSALDKDYWENKLVHVEDSISLPWMQDLDKIFAPTYKRKGILVPKTCWQSLVALGAKERLLPNTVLTAALFDVLAMWENENRLLVSMPISNSVMYPELSNHSSFIAIGYDGATAEAFVEKAQRLQKDVLEAMSHTSYSGIELGKMLFKQTNKLVSLPVAVTNGFSWGAADYEKAEYVSGLTQTPQLALDIRIQQTDAGVAIDFDFAEQALSELVINQMLQTLESFLFKLSKLESLKQSIISELTLETPPSLLEHYQAMLSNKPDVEDYLKLIHNNLYGKNKRDTALIFADKKMSYEVLGKHVARIANYLAKIGLKKGNVVAICMTKSPEHIAVTLACSLTNIIWLPVDMDSPSERIQFMINNCRADLIISDRTLEYGVETANVHQIIDDESLSEALDTSGMVFDGEPGYYLYTSGSTGTPKCVVMNHLATANVVEHTNKTWKLTGSDIMFSATPFHHDMSVYELFAAMSLGSGFVVPTPEQAKSGMDWARLIQQYQVTVWSSVPAIVDMLMVCAEPEQIQSLKLVSQGGDYVKPTVINKLREYLPHARLFSIGGPTETTIWSIWHEITDEDKDIIPYGDNFKGNRYYIMNEKGQHCPHYVVGTMCMSGVNLANGYLKEGVINQNDFSNITTPEGQEVRVFKTSDRGFFRDDGKIIFSGRKEGYLKIRGVRIAASEIELSLTQHLAVRDAIVMACVNPQYQTSEMVVAYVFEHNLEVATSELRQFLKGKVPNSHVPSRWLPLDEFPLTRNKKVDRKKILSLADERFYQKEAKSEVKKVEIAEGFETKNTLSEPSSGTEGIVIKTFADALGESKEGFNLQTEILSLGLRPKQLGDIAKTLTQLTKQEITLYSLVKSKSIADIVGSLSGEKNAEAELIR